MFTTPPADGAEIELVTLDVDAVQPIVGVPDPATLPLRPEEVAALRPEDRDGDPDLVRTHRRGPVVAYGFALALPLVLGGAGRWLPDWPYPAWLLLTAPVVALGCFGGWRLYLRPRLSWNGPGVSVVGVAEARLLGGTTWRRSGSTPTDGPGRDAVPRVRGDRAPRRSARLAVGHDERSGTQLAAALRLAKHRAEERERAGERDVTSLPPAPVEPRAPAALWVVGLLEAVVYAWLLSAR